MSDDKYPSNGSKINHEDTPSTLNESGACGARINWDLNAKSAMSAKTDIFLGTSRGGARGAEGLHGFKQ